MNQAAMMVQEMGLGPVWVRRGLPVNEVEEVMAPVAVAPVVAVPAPVAQPQPAVPVREAVAQVQAEVARVSPPAVQRPADPVVQDEDWGAPPPWLDAMEDMAPAGFVPDFGLPDAAPAARPAALDMDWPQLKETVAACRACGLCNGRKNTVFGVGDEQARWLFVGEGPGRNEDQQGEPFVGKAGQLLDSMLHALDLQRGRNVYIANIVKCRPTDDKGYDRKPTPEEAGACLPYLQRQIALVKPTVIVALGQTAAWALLGDDPGVAVGRLRGMVHRHQEIPVVVTYHPSYLLRENGRADRAKAWADLCLARGVYNKAGA